MNYIDIINSDYFRQTYSKVEEIKKDYPVNHGFIHINNVIKNAKRLAKTFKLTKNEKELLLVACTLHDIGYLSGRDDHAQNGSIIAKEILKIWDFNNSDIEIITNAIKNHGGKQKEDFQDRVSMCLIIADKLDFINSRYDKSKLKESYLKIFPNINDTYLDYKNNKLILNIFINQNFSLEDFQESNYYNKLNNFLNLLSQHLNCTYTTIYTID